MRSIVDATAPAERLAAFRVVLGVFVLAYLLIRLPVFLALAERREEFDGVGVFSLLTSPLPEPFVIATVALSVASGACFVAGLRFRATGPLFAIGMLLLTSYRSSWGQLLHFEHLFVLHLLIVGLSPAADAWSVDARRGARGRPPGPAYGWPLSLCSLVLVVTYVIAGIAKLRYGGLGWITGDTLRNHVAYSAARLDVLGGTPSPLARPSMGLGWLFSLFAGCSVAVELAAPLALIGQRTRNLWVAATFLMHLGIFALMLVGFPYPLFLAAFAPLFHLERVVQRVVPAVRQPTPGV